MDVKKFFEEYTDKDPVQMIRKSTIKSAFIIFCFLAVAFLFNFNKNLIILALFFIANMVASVLMGSIELKRKVFIYYVVSAMIIIHVSTFVHPIFEEKFMLIVPFVYLCFWVRRFGEAFNFFPMMLTVMICITFVKFPLFDYNQGNFFILSIILSIIFYIFLIRDHQVMTNDDVKKTMKSLIQIYIKSYEELLHKAKSKKISKPKLVEPAQKKFESIIALQSQGMMLLEKAKVGKWRFFCHNIIMLNRLLIKFILNYKQFNLSYLGMGFNDKEEVKRLSRDMERMFVETLKLCNKIVSTNDESWQKRIAYVEHLKYRFEVIHVEKYKHDRKKREVLFSNLFLLDDMFLAIENSREAYNDFLKA